MVGLQTLDLAIGVRVPASQPRINENRESQTADSRSATILFRVGGGGVCLDL